ncbi:hypothetical protein GGR52DRAFT_532032 [Hypoxylon sp. FL1284]|nr:hypothetical protein GGR52DRAFT_532032 [Hypoxylon sp. FL1284]
MAALSKHPAHVVATVELVQKGIRNKAIKMTTSHLDFYSGKPDDNGQVFLEPFPAAEMRHLMDQKRPWLAPRGCPSILPTDEHLDSCWQARHLWNALRCYLKFNQDDLAPGILEGTGWDFYMDERVGRLTDTWPWKVESFLDRFDSAKPHVICFLSNHKPLTDMVPSTVEIRTILYTVGSRMVDKKYQHHRIVPITIISAAGYSLRITQGFVDQDQLFVRMTSIFDFTAGEHERWDDFIQALCWIVGKPVGITV